MNHIQMFNQIQSDTEYSWEIRSMLKHINNEANLERMRTELNMLVLFIEQKIQDSSVLLGLPVPRGWPDVSSTNCVESEL